jgi:hypothetical protein
MAELRARAQQAHDADPVNPAQLQKQADQQAREARRRAQAEALGAAARH